MQRFSLLAGAMVLLVGAVPSSGAIVFYTSEAAWAAAHTSITTDTLGTGTVAHWGELTYSPYVSGPTGATVSNQSREASNGVGNWTNSSVYIYGSTITPDLGSGRYLDPGNYYQDYSGIRLTGTEVETLINGAWVYDAAASNLSYNWVSGNYQVDQRMTVTAPAGQNGFAFGAGTWTGGARAISVTVSTVGGTTQTYYGLAASLGLTFFGFGTDNGDTISQVTIQGLFAPVSDNVGPAWTVNGDTRYRTFSNNLYTYSDPYRLVVDNLSFALTAPTGGSGDPPPAGGDPPPGEGGEAPEGSTFFLAGSGLLAASYLARKRRHAFSTRS